ncbi:MAG: hypothetical protein GTN38_00010 [Candidatus Aenigmarchaeota archaeon]|nr:hypothetical protein [Candidatus Aenigmarchaeota archaeon]NIP39888.1 hypothetical protein [Candidatus Aenigmarchaeota archaeon]NIQ17607.1 hypothetical protein [Candidatus Aenigmarchaeota archaeon]NIS72795.1 hypothetical protein [Candidatus Aenigmarchaeota archaeon]
MKNGFLLSLDALIAISLLMMISIFLVGLSYTYSSPDLRYQRYYYAGKDLVILLEQTKMGSVSFFPSVQDYLSRGVLGQGDMNRTMLDVVGAFWAAGNQSYAENLTRDMVNSILNNTAYGFEVIMNGETIYQNGSVNPDFIARLTTIVSGYEKTKPVNGYVAKVYMTRVRKTGLDFIYFGGYVGDGNVTRFVTLPEDANVTNVYLEMNTGNNFTLYINEQQAGTYVKTEENFSADKWTVCSETVNPSYCSYFSGGNNSITLNFTGSGDNHIGGGYLKVSYTTSELTGGNYVYAGNTTLGRYWFPGIKGLINLYSSFYVPGTLKNISVRLHYRNNLTLNNVSIPLYFIIGSEEILRSNETGEKDIYISDENISGIFGGKTNLTNILSNATIPIRFGTETFSFISGEAASDSVLITDISGSMDTCDVQTSECLHADCNDASGCQNRRIDVAKDVDKEFVNTILNYTGNRAGLVSYETVVDEVHPLSNDSSSLISHIDGYAEGGWTCISCGILVARDMIIDSRMVDRVVPSKSSWLYNTSYPSGEPPNDANGTSWKEHNYTDSGWSSGQTILGFESTPYSPNVDTDIGDNGGDYFFRKHFNVNDVDSIRSAEMFVLSDDNAEVYLNGYLINNDTEEHRARYWNMGGTIFYDDFESYYASGDNRLYYDEINLSPGYWIVNGTPSGDKEIFLMADYSGYPAHSGTDVLVFRDMDDYGYAETYLNLSGKSNLTLSYWWAMGPGELESGDYSDVWIWDGSWHELRRYNRSHVYGGYTKEEIDLSGYNMIDNFTIRFGAYLYSFFGGDSERFYVDDVRVSEMRMDVDRSYFRSGDNVIAVELRNNDPDSAKFDLELNVTMKRHEAILVMSDGFANRPPGLNASKDAIDKACETRDTYGMDVYVVAFGLGADNETLERVACWNCSENDWIPGCDKFYKSASAEGLKEIYKDIADDIANATYQAQIFNVTGNVSLDNILYPDSFISFNYTPIVRTLEYGEITMRFESPRLRDSTGEAMITDNETGTKEGWFTIPSNTEVVTKVLDSKITSYSSYYWTDRLWVNSSNTPNQNWTNVYWLGNYSDEYEFLGDPYIIQIPPNLLKTGGNNSFKIGTGLYPSLPDGLGASPDDRVIYTMGITGIGLTEYSDVFLKAKGSSVTIYYDIDGDNTPETSVVVEVGPNPNDVFDPENDSIDNGFMKLIDRLNFISDLNPNVVDLTHNATGPTGNGDGSLSNPIDLEITEEVKFQSDFISQIPSMWGPATMEVRVWS